MQIERDKVVTMNYRVSDGDGTFSESSEGGDPVVYLHGHGSIVPGLEKALLGKQAGDELSVELAPEDGYGRHDPGAVQRVPIKHLIRPGKLTVGKTVAVNTDSGHRGAIVLKVGRFNVDVDFNHPLAGKHLHFDVTVLDVRDASPEELAHGHAHGPGGHH
jgi:FKBP-type peptidyl-prolyl cis-trans isomerase SlyD